MKDLARFLAVLAIFVFGFSMQFVALNQPFHNLSKDELIRLNRQGVLDKGYFASVQKNPISAFELLFFAVFGQTSTEQLKSYGPNAINRSNNQPDWTEVLFKFVFGVYMLVSVVVLINLLIAMMTDTYQRIQVMDR
ncbi:hypothetical protein JTB14_033051 [Gonioctena quinquepunctata]|nr:hypothetical protein JTB14_033051 [Gonioctena quinquepunctata]